MGIWQRQEWLVVVVVVEMAAVQYSWERIDCAYLARLAVPAWCEM